MIYVLEDWLCFPCEGWFKWAGRRLLQCELQFLGILSSINRHFHMKRLMTLGFLDLKTKCRKIKHTLLDPRGDHFCLINKHDIICTVVTNHHKLGGLEKQKCIPLQFWKGSPESRCQEGVPWRLQAKTPFLSLPHVWWLPTIPGVLRSADRPLQTLLFTMCILPSVSLCLCTDFL